ncbi:hypothetical protein ZWY2020_010907 [Hordeum vulgare]|nr:hypothetical protein ZWY2020_010907 [Hordeum vulgare]
MLGAGGRLGSRVTRLVLHHRRRLRLRYNALSGALPSDLVSLAALRSVFLNGNRLSGNFPAPLLAQPGLLHLSLGGNGHSCAIPPALANLTRLRTLLLEENRPTSLPPAPASRSAAPPRPLSAAFASPFICHFAVAALHLSRRCASPPELQHPVACPPPPPDSLHRCLLLAQPQRPAAPSPSSSDGPPSTRKELDMVPTGGCYYRIANPMPRVEIGHGKIKLGLQMGYLVCGFWALNNFPTFYYVIIPSLCFLSGVSVFPAITSPWCIPFIYVVVAAYSWSLMESLQCGDTAVEWWNAQRMWLKRRTTSYLLAAIDTIGGMLGISESGFELTVKVDESQAMERYKKGKMEFGPISGMFVIITTISLFNLACLVLGLGRVLLREGATGLGPLFLQAVLCMAIVVINAPVYEALFIRRDSGSLPYFFTLVSLCFVSSLCLQAT